MQRLLMLEKLGLDAASCPWQRERCPPALCRGRGAAPAWGASAGAAPHMGRLSFGPKHHIKIELIISSWENAHNKVIYHKVGGKAEHCTVWGTKGGSTQRRIQGICLMGFHSLFSNSSVI